MEPVTFRVQNSNLEIKEVTDLNKIEEMLCRICFDCETDNNPLVNPCKCSGTMRWVHEECLKIWVLASNADIKEANCDICKEKFDMEVMLVRIASCKNFKNECFKLLMLPLVICLVGTIFTVIIYYLVLGISTNNLSTEEKVYFSLVITACMLIICSLLVMCCNTLRAACTEIKMKEWHIKSIKYNNAFEETFDLSHQTEISHREGEVKVLETARINQNIVVPDTVRYRGNNIVIPIFNPVTLSRLNRNEDSLNYFSNTSRSITARAVENQFEEIENIPGTIFSATRARK